MKKGKIGNKERDRKEDGEEGHIRSLLLSGVHPVQGWLSTPSCALCVYMVCVCIYILMYLQIYAHYGVIDGIHFRCGEREKKHFASPFKRVGGRVRWEKK